MNALIRYGADERRFTEAAAWPDSYLARVISQYPGMYDAVTERGVCRAQIAGRLLSGAADPTELPVVGDFVMLDRADDAHGEAIIERVLPRRSAFTRAAAGSAHAAQTVAVNIDVAFVCMALDANYSLRRLERYLSAAWGGGATPVVVLTKADLCGELAARLLEAEAAAPGADVLAVSSWDEASVARVRAYLPSGVTGAFLGSSGVGKSTLINALYGETLHATGETRADGKGRHTTTRRELLPLPGGGVVIDTPGMRELGVETVDLSKAFAEIDALAAECRFSDCTHTAEPGCAVRRAVEDGTLDAQRLESWRKLAREARYSTLNARMRENARKNDMFAHVGGMKNVRKYIRANDKRKED